MNSISLAVAAFAASAAATLVVPTLAKAQTAGAHGAHGAHGAATAPASTAAVESPATAAYRAANDRMHRDMDIAFTGDADADFVRGMLPHHRGAVEMARVVLEHGADPRIRALAEDVIREQEREIAELEAWLAEHGR